MILLALLIGFVLGGLTATAACALWAFNAMHPHDELSDLERYAVQLEDRLEIDPRHPYDGIYCRDETIRLQDQKIARLLRENHNLNWALGIEGYEQMATPEEQAEHDEAVRATDDALARMAAFKAEHDAKYRDAERYRCLRNEARSVDWSWWIAPNGWRSMCRNSGAEMDADIDAVLAQVKER